MTDKDRNGENRDPGNQNSDDELDDFARDLGAKDAKDVRDEYDKD